MESGIGLGMLLLLLTGGGMGPMLGLPPGPSDASLSRCPPTEAVVYVEWTERGGGVAGAPGLEGLLADHEIQSFVNKVETAITEMIERESYTASDQQRELSEIFPRLARQLLKRPGCFYLSFDGDNVIAPGGGPETWMSLAHGLRFSLIISGGKSAEAIETDLKKLVEFLPESLRKETLDRQPLPIPLPGVPVLIHRHNDYFILSVGDGSLDAAIAGLDGKSNGLTDSDRYKAGMRRVTLRRTGSLTWIDTKQILKTVASALEPAGIDAGEMLGALGLDSLDYVASAVGLENGQIRSRQFIATGGDTHGILKLAGGRGITNDDFSNVPYDADFVFALSLDGSGVLNAIREIVTTVGDGPTQGLDDALGDFERETGLSLENDLLQAFGDVWTVYNSPSGGGFLFSGLVASVEVRDYTTAQASYRKILDAIRSNLPGVNARGYRARGATLKDAEFLTHNIYYVNIVGDDDTPIAPSFCLTKNHLHLALHPQNIKAHLRAVATKGKKFSARLETELSIPNGDLICLSSWDAQATLKLLYSVVPYVGQVLMSELQSKTGVDLDIFDIPSARAVLPYVGKHSSTVVRTNEGIFSSSTSGLPIPLGAGMGMLMPFIQATQRQSRRINEPPAATREAPAPINK